MLLEIGIVVILHLIVGAVWYVGTHKLPLYKSRPKPLKVIQYKTATGIELKLIVFNEDEKIGREEASEI